MSIRNSTSCFRVATLSATDHCLSCRELIRETRNLRHFRRHHALRQCVFLLNTSHRNVLFLNICCTWHLSLGSISFDEFLFHIFGMMISVSFDIFRKHTFFGVSLLHVYYFLFGLERIASTLVVTPGGLHRTTACCFLTASFWHSWSTARLSVRLGSSCSFF